MFGFGLGGASLGFERSGTSREVGWAGNLRIGYALRPDLVVHFEGTAWWRTFNESYGQVRWTHRAGMAAVTFYPPIERLFLRTGVGYGKLSSDPAITAAAGDETGVAFLAALGYESRLSARLALASQFEFIHQDLERLGTANLVGFTLGPNLYW